MIITSRRAFLKQLGVGTAGAGLLLASTDFSRAAAVGKHVPRSTPESQGVSSEGILAFLDALASSKHEFHSFMFLRHGHVIAEGWWHPYRAEAPHMLYSLSKSFTSTGVGLAVAEKRLTVNDKVISFFPEDLPSEVSDNLGALRVRDLLSMSVGHAQDSTGTLWGKENWVRQFLSLPIVNPPGTAFLYNSGATYMLSAIVQKLTGQKLIDYLRPRLFEPLSVTGMTWETCPRGINTGGWGLKLPTEALAKFGQLYLQKGQWNGKQILPAAWIEEATTFKIQQPSANMAEAKPKSDWLQGYCYQFWRCRHNAYRGDGAFGQYTIVLPEQDAVIAITSESPSMQGEMDLIWEHLLPAMKDGVCPANKAAESRLKATLGKLQIKPVAGQQTSAVSSTFSGRKFVIPENALGAKGVSFDITPKSCVFRLEDAQGMHAVNCGLGKWIDGATDMPGTPPKLTQGKLPPVSKVAGSAAWKDDHTLEMVWQFYETPHHDKVTCRFGTDQVEIEFLDSMTAMNPGRKDRRPVLKGTARA